MDIRQLELFVLLAKELHFAQTAKRAHMTASALSRLIQRLEDEVGVALLLRNNRRVELTLAGREFVVFAQNVLLEWQKIQDNMRGKHALLAGNIRIYSSVTASYSVLSVLLSDFRKQFPQIEIQLHTGDQAEAIDRVIMGADDVAVAALPDHLPDAIVFKTLTFSPLRFIMPSDSGAVAEQVMKLRRASTGPINMSALPLIVPAQGLTRDRLNQWLKQHQLTPNIYAQVSGHEAIVSMVALGFGVGLVPELVVQHSSLAKKIRIVDDAPQLPALQIGLCVQKAGLENTVVRAFWDAADPAIFKGVVNARE
jgi:LysR family positive regulator for ilvC